MAIKAREQEDADLALTAHEGALQQGSSLLAVLDHRAQTEASRVGWTFLADGESEHSSLTYGELGARSSALAAEFARAGFRGRTALLVHPPGLEFVTAFFACLSAGVIAIPAFPPEWTIQKRLLSRLEAIARDAEPAVVLTTREAIDGARGMVTGIPSLDGVEWIATDDVGGTAGELSALPAAPDDVAYLQYTSGSTSSPKGVMVTQANVMAVCQAADTLGLAGGVTVCWLPVFHDFGLIYGVVGPVYMGFPTVLMPPLTFLEKPIRWLQAISNYGAVNSGGPNFGYDLCVRRTTADDRRGLDLSRWRGATNGAEPIRTDTLELFAETFAPYGFRRQAFSPGYGLAEATLSVSVIGSDEAPRSLSVDTDRLRRGEVAAPAAGVSSTSLASSGRPLGCVIAIVNPETGKQAAENRVGEIWVAGQIVTAGYWRRPEETAATFGARLESRPEQFLRTGDLGFLSGGDVFIAGRLKDLIIIQGANHYPQDIELSVERSHPAVRRGCSAAFAIEAGGTEKLAVVCEVDPHAASDFTAVAEAIRIGIGREHGIQCSSVTLISPRSIPKTSSGKIQRRACRQELMDGELDALYQWKDQSLDPPQRGDEERIADELAGMWRKVLKLSAVPHDVGFFDLGGSSVLAAEVIAAASDRWGVELPLTTMLAADTVADLAAAINTRLATNVADVPIVINDKGTKPVLFFISHFSGTTLAARHLARRLGDDQPICVLLLATGREGAPVRSVEEAANLYIKEIRKVQAHGPYRLSGLSLGCTFAFEVAHQLRVAGEDVVLLAMIDGSPDRPSTWQAIVRQARRLSTGLRYGRIRQTLQIVGRRAQWVFDRSVEGAPPASLEAAVRLAYHYRNLPTYDGTMVLLTTPESVRKHGDPTLGWQRWVPAGVRTIPVACDHFDLTQDSGVAEVAQHLRKLLDEVLPAEDVPDRTLDSRQAVAT